VKVESTVTNTQSTGFQSPPGPPSERLPMVASQRRYYYCFNFNGRKTAGHTTLTFTEFGLDNGVHHRYDSDSSMGFLKRGPPTAENP